MKARLSVEATVTPAELAEMFCAGDDEEQAQFFIEVARIAATWVPNNSMQWFYVGRHLRNCACSTEAARDIVREIAQAIE